MTGILRLLQPLHPKLRNDVFFSVILSSRDLGRRDRGDLTSIKWNIPKIIRIWYKRILKSGTRLHAYNVSILCRHVTLSLTFLLEVKFCNTPKTN